MLLGVVISVVLVFLVSSCGVLAFSLRQFNRLNETDVWKGEMGCFELSFVFFCRRGLTIKLTHCLLRCYLNLGRSFSRKKPTGNEEHVKPEDQINPNKTSEV